VFEKVHRDIPLDGVHWFFDHAETVGERNLERIARLGGGIAVQHRMAYQGEYFVERYGAEAAEHTPPFKRMLELGIKVGAGTDATRVASYDPWTALYWLTTGRTIGGASLYPARNRIDRFEALDLYTRANTWFSNEEGIKGQIKVGQLADFAVLADDYFSVPEERIRQIVSLLTVVDGKIVYADGEFKSFDPPTPAPMPDWSPVNFGSRYWKSDAARATMYAAPPAGACGVHAHEHAPATGLADALGFWGALGCSCWAF
jgi:predicted amidohydrolase YtcJ